MKQKNLLLLFVLLAGLVALYFYNKYKVAPGFDLFSSSEFVDVNGKSNKGIGDLKGKKIIVTFYASWCGDCLKEMKTLNELKSASLKDVEIVAITDEPVAKFESFIQRKNYPFHFYRFTKTFAEMGVHSIPVNYLVNTKGETVYEKVGAVNWENPEFVKQALRMME
jgi:thiol-disulfide isomerase/thioredoxin